MKYTGNYKLKKPEGSDIVNIDDLNDNADIIDTELNKKVVKVSGKGLSTNDYTTAEKNKLSGIESGANKYIHPDTHLASIIIESATRRFVSDTEKANWNSKETPSGAQAKVDTHEKKKTNPHNVTKSQVNLSNVDNVKQASKVDFDEHKADYIHHTGYGVARETNTKIITLDPAPTSYKNGMAFAFANITQNTGAVTINVNGLGAKRILKSDGNALSSGNLKANSIYTVRFNGTNFILQGEGGEYGNALASDVLSPKTIGTKSGIVTGTMIDRGTVNQTLTTQGGQYTIHGGKHSGSGKVTVNISNLVSGNIKKGVNVGGVVGTVASANTIDVGDIILKKMSGFHSVVGAYVGRLDTVESVIVNVGGMLRVEAQVRGNEDNYDEKDGLRARGYIYKNDEQFGSEFSSKGSKWDEWGDIYSVNISVSPGDKISLKLRANYWADHYIFWIKGNRQPVVI